MRQGPLPKLRVSRSRKGLTPVNPPVEAGGIAAPALETCKKADTGRAAVMAMTRLSPALVMLANRCPLNRMPVFLKGLSLEKFTHLSNRRA